MDEAIADFGRAISTNPGNKDFLQARASAFAANGPYAAAEKDFNAALALDPLDAIAYVGRAEARLKLGATAESLDDANRALLVDPSLASAYAARADVDAASGQSDKAAADRQAADNALGAAEKSRQAAAAVWAHPHLRVTVSGTFPTSPPTLKRTFTLDSVIEVRDDEVTYHTSGLGLIRSHRARRSRRSFRAPATASLTGRCPTRAYAPCRRSPTNILSRSSCNSASIFTAPAAPEDTTLTKRAFWSIYRTAAANSATVRIEICSTWVLSITEFTTSLAW